MTPPLTVVKLIHLPERADAWLRFGHPYAERRRGRHALAFFVPGTLFGYVDWRANEFGTVRWTFCVLRAGDVRSRLTTLPGVTPGAQLLLRSSGKAAVKRVFAYLDTIEAAGVDPADVDPDHWGAVANRLAARDTVPPFDRTAHEASLVRRGFTT